MSAFLLISLVGWVAVVVLALFRSRAYAIFRGVTLGLQVLFAAALVHRFQSRLVVPGSSVTCTRRCSCSPSG